MRERPFHHGETEARRKQKSKKRILCVSVVNIALNYSSTLSSNFCVLHLAAARRNSTTMG